MNARMVTMEVALTDVPIPMEATSVRVDVVINSRGKVNHLEVELVVWSTLMLEGSVKVDYYFNMLLPACLASFLVQSLVTRRNLQVLQCSMKYYKSIIKKIAAP